MKFNYQARTKKGEIHTGNVEASSKEAAIALLQKHGLYVTFLESARPPAYAKRVKVFERISRKDLVLFSRQLAIMFRSKVPLVESLKVLSLQIANLDFKEKVIKLSEEVEGGTSFSKAISQYPEVFSAFYVAMVKSGEISGKLSEVLDYLADHLEREYRVTAKMQGALIYPSLIVFVVLLVLSLMVFIVIPQLSAVLAASNVSLPLITKIVIGFAAFLREAGWILLLLLSALLFFCFRYYSTKNGKRFFDRLFLKLPIFGSIFKTVYLARFAENLSTLISGGLPIAQALEAVGDIIASAPYKEVIFKTRDEVRRGEPISSVLSQSPELFPPVFVQMVIVGEKTGSLDTTLMSIVNFYQDEIDRAIDNVLNVLEPALIVILGAVVAGLMLSILMPMYKMIAI